MSQTVTAQLKYLRITPRKTRLVADLIRGLPVTEAEAQLMFLTQRAGLPILKLLRSAIANAKANAKLIPEDLYVKEVRVDAGPKLKRFMPRSRGSAYRIEKKMSHVSIVLDTLPREKKASRFVITRLTRKEREKAKEKSVKARSKRQVKPTAQKSEGDQSHEAAARDDRALATEKQTKKPNEPGVFKRVFRRKAV